MRNPTAAAKSKSSNGGARPKVSTAELIRTAAIDLFYEHGYEATSLRAVATEVGIQVGSLYNHLASKEDLLFSIMSKIIDDFLTALDVKLSGVEGSMDRLKTTIDVHVLFHTSRSREVFIGNSELRSLSPAHRRKVVKLRDEYEQRFVEIIEQGVDDGTFKVEDPKLAAWAILAIATSTSTWYKQGGRLQLEAISGFYTDFVLHGISS